MVLQSDKLVLELPFTSMKDDRPQVTDRYAKDEPLSKKIWISDFMRNEAVRISAMVHKDGKRELPVMIDQAINMWFLSAAVSATVEVVNSHV